MKAITVGSIVKIASPISETEKDRFQKHGDSTYLVTNIRGDRALCGGWWFNIAALEQCEASKDEKKHWGETDSHLAKFGLRRR